MLVVQDGAAARQTLAQTHVHLILLVGGDFVRYDAVYVAVEPAVLACRLGDGPSSAGKGGRRETWMMTGGCVGWWRIRRPRWWRCSVCLRASRTWYDAVGATTQTKRAPDATARRAGRAHSGWVGRRAVAACCPPPPLRPTVRQPPARSPEWFRRGEIKSGRAAAGATRRAQLTQTKV